MTSICCQQTTETYIDVGGSQDISLHLVASSATSKLTCMYLSSAQEEINEPRCEKTGLRGFRPGPTTIGPHKMARNFKFRIQVVEGLYYPYSENKGADQRRS